MAQALSSSLPDHAGITRQSRIKMRLAVAAGYFCPGLCFASWASRIPDIKTSLQLSQADLGTLLFALPMGQLLTLPFSGRLIAHFGSKKILSFAIILYAIELTNLGLVNRPWQLGLALFFFGVFGNLCNISLNTQGVHVEKIYGRSIMSSFHGAWSTSGIAGALLGILFVSLQLSPHLHFIIIAAIVITLFLSVRQFLIPGNEAEQPKKKFFSKPDIVLMQLGIIGFCCMAAEGTMFDWSGVYFKEVVKVSPELVIVGYASFMTMMAAGRFAGDKIIGRIGRKRTLQLSGVFIAIGLLTAVTFPNLVTATIGFMIVGLGVSSVVPSVYSAAGRHAKISLSIALASVSSISFLGFLIGPPLIGYIAEAASLRYSFAVIAVIGCCITFMVSRLKVLE